jgi:type VI secretion system protein ImpH
VTERPEPARGTWRFLPLMRWLERRAGDKPRVGQSRRVHEDVAELGQDPYMGFARTELSEADLTATPPRVRPRFLGFFGPFGPLPSAMTREVMRWVRRGDDSFVRFTDIFATRFQQLYYRAWSDARAITQFDHPSGGTFPDHLRALTGEASPALRKTGAVEDTVRLRYTGLAMDRVRSPVRLRQMLRTHFGVPVRIDEFVPSWLGFAPEDCTALGTQRATLGADLVMGTRVRSIGEKITIHIECPDLPSYRGFLPGQTPQAELRDLVLGYLGGFTEIDVALWLPNRCIAATGLSGKAQLGWTTALPRSFPKRGLVRATTYQISAPIQ